MPYIGSRQGEPTSPTTRLTSSVFKGYVDNLRLHSSQGNQAPARFPSFNKAQEDNARVGPPHVVVLFIFVGAGQRV